MVEKRMKTALRHISPIQEDAPNALIMRWVLQMARVLRALDSSDSTQDKDTVEYLPDHLLATRPKKKV